MLKKIQNFCFDPETTIKWVGIVCLVLVTVAVFTVGFNDLVKPIFVYPEKEYQLLESEAQRIIDEQTLNTEFKHDVNYSNTLENKSVDVKIYGDGASVVIDVDNYGEETESVNVYRSQSNGAMYHILNFATLILAILLFAFYLGAFVMAILLILGAVCKFFDWMIRAIRY